MSNLILQHLAVRDVRNLRAVDVQPAPATNIVCGDNGQGKTSLLEAIYFLATTRSFRTARPREMICHQAPGCSVRGQMVDDSGTREQFVAITGSQRVVKLDGQRPVSLASYAVRTPVVVFHPGELSLTMGPAAGRRTLLDRVALYVSPSSHEHHGAYVQAMRARQRLLLGGSDRGLSAYEHLMAEHGAELTKARREAAERLMQATQQAFEHLAPPELQLRMRYEPSGTDQPDQARQRLHDDRDTDRRRASASFGPHRDELVLLLGGRRARVVASQGQHRLLTLALKIAEMVCVQASSQVHPLLLLDDVSSELDAGRTSALFQLLGQRGHQVFITTTRRELLGGLESRGGPARVFEVRDGRVTACE